MGANQFIINHGAHIVFGQFFHFHHFVRCAEAVENVQKRYTRFEGGGLGNQREIHHFLHRTGEQLRKTGAACRHHVAVVAENGQRLRRHRPRRNVEHRAGQLARNFVHIGYHQQQPLRSGESGRQRTGGQCAVNRTRRATFGLHFNHSGNGSPNVRFVFGRFLVSHFPHR